MQPAWRERSAVKAGATTSLTGVLPVQPELLDGLGDARVARVAVVVEHDQAPGAMRGCHARTSATVAARSCEESTNSSSTSSPRASSPGAATSSSRSRAARGSSAR